MGKETETGGLGLGVGGLHGVLVALGLVLGYVTLVAGIL